MANKSIYDAFERMWQHITAVAGGKSDKNHNHDDLYYTESEVDNLLENIGLDKKADLVDGKVPSSQLPSYVDDVIEGTISTFPSTGESGKIYVDTITNKSYRWGNTQYVEISSSLALGETSATAYRGDHGKTAYDHSQIKTGNPHGTTAADIGAAPSSHTHAASHITSGTLSIERGGTGGATRKVGFDNLAYLGESPIKTTATDTTANWSTQGTGYAWYATAGQLNNQPSTWGILINFVYSSEVFQIWNSQNSGPVYVRSGNASGWGQNWTKLYDEQHKPTAADIGAAPSSHTHTKSQISDFPTIPTVNNATLTIQKNGTNVTTFTANSASNATANITVPTGAAADKGVDTSISAASTSTNLPTSKAVAAFVEGKGYKTTDNNDKVTCTKATTTKYYVAGTTSSTTSTTGLTYDTGVYVDTTAGKLVATSVYGAVWNDYAEYRQSDITEAGRVICENGDDTLSLATERLQPGANIVSDTFGFAIGETDECKTPVAVSGRVLVYPYEDRESYKPGDAVCAAPNGTVSKMTREEIREYPERIIGTVSAIPSYETWGTGNVKVNGRIWIKVK